jgi:hypothetical protein
MRFAKRVFLIAGIYGVLLIAPMYFLEGRIAEDSPPAITHPEYYYGFVGCALAWQLTYLLISTDPLRFRPVMLMGALAKGDFLITVGILYAQGRAPGMVAALASVDGLFAVLFIAAWLRTRED